MCAINATNFWDKILVISPFIGFVLGFLSAIFAEPIKKWLFNPNLIVDFKNTRDYIVPTPEEITENKDGKIIKRVSAANYIRVKVTNSKKPLAKDCRAYLINIEKQDDKGKFSNTTYSDSIPLAWASQQADFRYDKIDIPYGVKQYVDVIVTRQGVTNYEPQILLKPFRDFHLFSETGSFRFTIQVSGDAVKSVFIKLTFKWNGTWDRFEVC